MIKSVLLAVDYDPAVPIRNKLGSGKIDGYRIHNNCGRALTRSNKSPGNIFVTSELSNPLLAGLDGEGIVGDMNDPKVFQDTSSGFKRSSGEPDFKWVIFDDYTMPLAPYEQRLAATIERVDRIRDNPQARHLRDRLFVMPHEELNSDEDLEEFEGRKLGEGLEGVMLRSKDGVYKFGRSTLRSAELLKVKRFSHGEGSVIGFVELMHNDNEAFTDELGRTKRSEKAEGLYPSGMLGAYIVSAPEYSKPFNVSCGSMTHAERKAAWEVRDIDKGGLVRFKYFKHGMKDVPRHGLYAGFRDPSDL